LWQIKKCLITIYEAFIIFENPPSLKLRRVKVEVRRIELLSKHILQKLSTCLFAD